ncbi:ATP-binding protein [Rhizobium sp. TRM95796]|uniref:ATP-binding protein n=1 Tax=Rhizobium sp. TRM95796 TaxID=2979862 RepID=UPI0021E75DBA|nr:helix-turn-helix transcriptional regulator [Rhizobium sp. TRM95796]MCV3765129.1 helix-turn-helix transcriptional regulator [Rhizobium sp. TRM95796]
MEDEVHFGEFVLRAGRRTLTRAGSPVALGSRAVDILACLTSHAGKLLTNAEIIRHAWPDTFVDETNLRVHISAIRRALGDTKREPVYITNVPGRGYTFIAEVTRKSAAPSEARAPVPLRAVPSERRTNSKVFGRANVIEALSEQLPDARLITIVGPGGIGKSTVARALLQRTSAEVVWVDLAELSSGELISTEVASKLEILARSENIDADIAQTLEGRDIVIVLDSCEHVVDEAALFVEFLLDRTSTPRFLATSREPLRAAGEWVRRLSPLDLPEATASVAEALASSAVQLFVERAAACRGGYKLTDDDVVHVVELCQQLDGIALAIELAAARMDTMSAKALSSSLKDSFRVLSRGRRTALLRHQTLRATLDWSYFVLTPEEQTALQQLSIFRGWFTADAASAVLDDPDDVVEGLVSKSLVVAEALSDTTRYRLLDTTRLYAAEKLLESGRYPATIARLAEYLCELFEISEQELYSASTEDWPEDFAQHVASLRLALEWAFEPGSDELVGVRLTVAALPLFFRLSLLDECLTSVTKAIAYLDAHPDLDERRRMKLYTALGWPQMRSTDVPEKGVDAWTAALRIAESLGDVDYQLRAIWAMWVDAINRAEPQLGLEFADKFASVAAGSTDPVDTVVAKRIRGATLHWLGRHEQSRELLEQMIGEYDALPSGQTTRFQFDQRITARIILARDLWMLGDGDAALTEAQANVEHAISIGHELSLTNVLAEAACPLALLEGRIDLAKDYIALLKDHTKSLSLDVWHSYANCFEAELRFLEGSAEECLASLRRSMAVLDHAGFNLFRTYFQALEARALASLGRFAEAHEVIDQALAHGESSGERWCRPELLRVKGLLAYEEGGTNGAAAAHKWFKAAGDEAIFQGAVAWECRVSLDVSKIPKSSGPADNVEFTGPPKTDAARPDRRALH